MSLRVCGSQPGGYSGLGDCGTVKLGRQRLLRIAGGGGVSRRSVSGAAECEGMLAGRSALMAASLVGGVCTRC